MSRERKAYAKEFKLMSVELSNTRSDLTALAKELDITPCCYSAGGRSIQANRIVVFLEMEK
jgi:hypothetical protein